MKTCHFIRGVSCWGGLFPTLIVLLLAQSAWADDPQPSIRSIRLEGSEIVVTANVSAGCKRLTLESRERAGSGGWEPRALARLDGTGGDVTFRLRASRKLELLRARADLTEPLPTSFYAGTNSFQNQPSGTPGSILYGLNDSAGGAPTGVPGGAATPTGGAQSREVVESDIWKIRDRTLYFFNQYRGLQLVDISQPDAATVRGTVELPAAGEEMYLLGDHHVILLARNGCNYSGDESQVVIVEDQAGGPKVVARLPVKGYILESRLVGTALYIASQTYRMVNGNQTTWEWGTVVSAFDLADPSAPVPRNTIWYSGYGNVVTATDRFLFVVTQDANNWWQSIVRVLDVSSPDGEMREYGSVATAGRVGDKFKMNVSGDVFTTISEDFHWDSGRRLVTKLETFRLPDPRSLSPAGIAKLGELELGHGERLHATRFDGNRAYVVTFFQIDPLWVVDLSNPAAPRITGQLDVPGWSTYIQPLGDQLIALGVETNRVTVSLFDVKDPAHPGLLSKVRLGQNYSWSEGTYNEKALTVLPEDGLILVPFSGDTTNGYASRVQLIDLQASALALRGLIEEQIQPRRAVLHQDRILSFSGWKLSSVDTTDRDHPRVTGETELAWTVDRLFLQGDHLIEMANLDSWGNQPNPVLRVTLANDPNHVVSLLSLTNLPVAGAAQKGSRLYLAQTFPPQYHPQIVPLQNGTEPGNTTTLLLTIVDLESLPQLKIESQAEAKIDSSNYGAQNLQAIWPEPGVLVWAGGGSSFWGWYDMAFPGGAGGMIAAPGGFRAWPPYWGVTGGQLIAFEVSDPGSPRFASQLNLSQDNWWSFSSAFTAGGLVYLSHQTTEMFEEPPAPLAGLVQPAKDPGDGTGVIDPLPPVRTWVQRSFLDVIDFADAAHPAVRQPVNIPGTLQGLSHEGSLLYTVGTRWSKERPDDWTEYLEASAYDGVTAHLVDSLALSNVWPRPLLVVETNLFLGRLGNDNASTDAPLPSLETWTLPETGKFTKTGSVRLAVAAQTLASVPGLLIAQETDNSVVLFDISRPDALPMRAQARPPGCLGFDLSNSAGEAARGLWIPLGAYGVFSVPINR